MNPFMRSVVATAFAAVFASGRVLAHEIVLPESLDDMALTEVAENIYVVHGMQALPDPDNHGFMSNSGILLTEDGVVLVDSGGSAEVAATLLDRIAALTDQPVVAIFNTHVHGDHWLGNAEVLARYPGIPVFAHRRAIERLKGGEAADWARIMTGLMGRALSDVALRIPSDALMGGERLSFGNTELVVHHTGHAHTDSDVMLEIPGKRLVFAGDVIEYGRAVSSDVPADFSITGQIAAIDHLLSLDVEIFVPGHGPTGGREVAQAARDFLTTLHESVARHFDDGLLDYQMRDRVAADMARYAGWTNFEDLGRLISYVWLQVEAASWE